MERVLKAIYKRVRKGMDYRSYVDLKDFCREVMKTDTLLARKYLILLRKSEGWRVLCMESAVLRLTARLCPAVVPDERI